MLIDSSILAFFSAATVVVHGLGIAHAAHAVMNVRSSRGAIAWSPHSAGASGKKIIFSARRTKKLKNPSTLISKISNVLKAGKSN